jgi:polyisoprenoid-binding protein YceI
MKLAAILVSLALSLGLLLGIQPREAEGNAAPAYQIDTVHSAVLFKVRHLGVGNSWGRFNDFSGSVVLDEENPERSSFQLEVKAASVDTANDRRDQHLRGTDFFSVKEFPLVTFKSKTVKKGAAGFYEAAGDLTLHGVTREVAAKVEHIGSMKDPRGGTRAGFETTFTIRRSDFGMKFMLDGIGDEVQVIASVEAVRK